MRLLIVTAALLLLARTAAAGPCAGYSPCVDVDSFAVRILGEVTGESAQQSGDEAQRQLIQYMAQTRFYLAFVWTPEERGVARFTSLPALLLKDGRRIEASDLVFSLGPSVQFVNPPVVCSDAFTDRRNSHALAIALAFPRTDAAGREWSGRDVQDLIINGGNP